MKDQQDWMVDWELMEVSSFERIVYGIYEANNGGNGVYKPESNSPRLKTLRYLPAYVGAHDDALTVRKRRHNIERKRKLDRERSRRVVFQGVHYDPSK